MKILLVDDIVINRFIIREMVKLIGHEYVEAENGLIALEYFKTMSFDMVFLDIEMPVMNGLETVRQMRTSFPEPKCKTKIYALTAYNPKLLNESINFNHFDGVVTKPYTIEKIREVLNIK
jgi:CheY-like chemotaxis protein